MTALGQPDTGRPPLAPEQFAQCLRKWTIDEGRLTDFDVIEIEDRTGTTTVGIRTVSGDRFFVTIERA